MSQIKFTQEDRKYLAVEVPEKAMNFRVDEPSFYLDYNYGGRSDYDQIHIANVETPVYSIISTLSTISEEQASEMVYASADIPIMFLRSRLQHLGMNTDNNILLISIK